MLKRFFLNLKELSDASIVSITKKRIWFGGTFPIDIGEIFSTNV